MAAPGTSFNPQNPFKSVAGQTYAGGRTNAINALQNPEDEKRKRTLSMVRARMGTGPQYTNEELYGNVETPSYGFGNGRGRTQQMAQPQSPTPQYSDGVLPARDGRMGYRGPLQDSGDTGSGLDWLNRGANQSALNEGAKNEVDPVSGLSMNPTSRQINDQLHMIAGQGDSEAGVSGRGLGGSRRTAALARYYDARASGDPKAIDAATSEVQGLKDTINKYRPNSPYQLAAGALNAGIGAVGGMTGATQAIAPKTMGQSVPSPYGAGTDEEDGIKQAMGKAKGGPVSGVHPYIVNEEGTESFQPDGQKPKLIPGGEHMTTFPKDGKVIPHGRTMRMMKEGRISIPQHRAEGGDTKATRGPLQHFGLLPPRSPLAGLERRGTRAIQRGLDALAYPFVEPKEPIIPLRDPYTHSPADLLLPENYGEAPVSSVPETAKFDEVPDSFWKAPTPVPPTPAPASDWLTPLLDQLRSGKATAQQQAAPLINAQQAMMTGRGVNTLPAPAGSASFLTPYGAASVARGAPITGPHVFEADGVTPWSGQPAPVMRPRTSELAAREAYASNQSRQKLYPDENPELMARQARNQALVDQYAADDEKAIGRSLAPKRRMGGPVSRTRSMAMGGKY